ncbi:MAG: glucosaminidase domain-containing protein, partial [Roseiflexaceae bacterium]|nr:glucosaminidase domain-containing protein [Roseiflexaceae bacterium]
PTPEPTPEPPRLEPEPPLENPPLYDAPLLGAPTGTPEQAARWLYALAGRTYDDAGIVTIVNAYVAHGDAVGLDWFLALAQNFHETDHLRSWWAQRPRRNPAGIGVTGATSIVQPSYGAWVWKEETQLWHEGVSFERWEPDAVKAHLGRLLAYALAEPQTAAQREMIDYALAFRSLSRHRGAAQTITGLNGKWAVPGSTYGQRIIMLRDQMRQM